MTILWLVTGAALVVALAAYRRARRTAQKLEQLSQMYWELKYQYGEMRQTILQPPTRRPEAAGEAAPAADQPRDGFVPLASLRR